MARKPAFISHSRTREAEIQRRMFDVLEGRFRRFIAAEIVAEGNRQAAEYTAFGTLLARDGTHQFRLRELYRQMALSSIRMFGARILTQGKFQMTDLERKDFAQVFAAMAEAFINLEAMRRRITSVSDTTRSQIIAIIERGQAEGFSVEQIAKMITEEMPPIARVRSRVIARTETHAAANYGAQEAARSTGLDLEKEWVAVEDHRTRDGVDGDEFNHRIMNGQTVPMDGFFQMPNRNGTFAPCQYPGDPALPAAGAINCRCVVVHNVIDNDA